jgi:phospholipid N-methyltransferase
MNNLASIARSNRSPNRRTAPKSDLGVFFSESVQSLSVTASLFPSSRYLTSALLKFIDFSRALRIVELGAGTGPVTSEILRRMRPDASLYALDINPVFVTHVRRKLIDRRLVPIVGRAEDLGEIIRQLGAHSVDAIISSLGLSSMDDQQRRRIISQAARHLHPTGILSQFQYLHAGGEPNWFCNVGFKRFSEERFLRQYFASVISERVILNLPPARVFTCRH